MKPFFLATAAALAIVSLPASAVKCAAPGAVSVFNVKGGFVFYVSKTYGDAAFLIPGKTFAKTAGAPPGTTQFTVDGVLYQFLGVPKAKFLQASGASDDATVLDRHARQEQQFAVNAGSKYSTFKDLGSRPRPAQDGNPAMVYKLWSLKNPTKPAGGQFMLSTVMGDEVALLSAIVPTTALEPRAVAAFDRFSGTYRLLKSEQECPPVKAGPTAP